MVSGLSAAASASGCAYSGVGMTVTACACSRGVAMTELSDQPGRSYGVMVIDLENMAQARLFGCSVHDAVLSPFGRSSARGRPSTI